MNMYLNSQIKVRWKIVKHIPVLYPILFALCLDDLITENAEKSDDCRIGMNYFGIVGFADDLKH